MRKALIGFLLIGLVSAMPVGADAVDDGLPPGVNEQVRRQTREMIQAGVPT